ncbi:MAG TPA: DUF6543 domain-containing protein [Pseudomonas sp.]|uniref:dermonecrotic toxin domain-containing protein n=1 Tax=Pseudomonas sp. TaxID=306 RepID=UPI002ED7B73A
MINRVNTLKVQVADKTDEHQLKDIARQFMDAYPDIHGMAYSAARNIMYKHTGKKFNPEKVYWHRFGTAVSSPRTFTGWQHVDPPLESMTFIELVMRRFSAQEQEAWDELQLYGGFYTDGPDHEAFDERNEVCMLPKDVMDDFWALDFSAVYARRMQRFWATHSEDFRTLAKSHFLVSALQCRRSGHLCEDDFQTVIHSVTDGLEPTMTLATLKAKVAPKAGISIHTFSLDEYVSRDILRIVDASGRQIVYVPGEKTAFHGFGSKRELYEWTRSRVADEGSRAAFTQHFLHSAAARESDGEAFAGVIDRLRRQEWFERPIVDRRDEFILGDPFEHVREIARQEMASDAFTLLTSNLSLHKQMWIGYLSAFTHVFGGLAPLGWPVALTVIGAGTINVGLNVDQAVNGASAQLRKAGVEAAIINSIFVLFNLPLLADIGEVGDGVEVTGAREDTFKLPSTPVSTTEPSVIGLNVENPLAGLEGNEILDDAQSLATEGRLRGVYMNANGQNWISLNDLPYQVRYSDELQVWTIVDPANPFAFYGANPVRLNAQGEWELLPAPKLKGGMDEQAGSSQMGGTPTANPQTTTASAFWEPYMQFNREEELRLSNVAMARQKDIVEVLEVPGEELVVVTMAMMNLLMSGAIIIGSSRPMTVISMVGISSTTYRKTMLTINSCARGWHSRITIQCS